MEHHPSSSKVTTETNHDSKCRTSSRIRSIGTSTGNNNNNVNTKNNSNKRARCDGNRTTTMMMADGKITREEKYRKWEAKQAQKRQQTQVENQRMDWIKQHSNFVSFVDERDVATRIIVDDQQEIKSNMSFDVSGGGGGGGEDPDNNSPSKNSENENERKSSSLAALLTPYFDIQENNKRHNNNNNNNNLSSTPPPSIETTSSRQIGQRQKQRLFIAEGTETVRILIRQSQITQPSPSSDDDSIIKPSIQVKSIFLKPSIFFDKPVHLLKDVEDLINDTATKYEDDNDDDSNKPKKQQYQHQKASESANSKPSSSSSSFHPGFHILIAKNESILSRVAGYPISRGVLACGLIPKDRNEEWLNRFLLAKNEKRNGIRLLALDGINDTSNLGSMVRCSSAFSIDAIILSKDCCDAWYRRSIRVSMGHIFRIPVVRVDDLATTIQSLCTSSSSGRICTANNDLATTTSNRLNIKSYAAVLDTNQLLSDIKFGSVPQSWCCVLGNEGNGISPRVAEAATQKIKIDIARGVDSLSVPIACGILLHGLKEREEQTPARIAN